MSHLIVRADAFHLPLPDASVDTVVTDPPWHFRLRVSPRAKSVRATNYPLILDQDMHSAFEEIYRVLRPRGHLYVFVPERKLGSVLELAVFHGFGWFNTIPWIKIRKDGTDIRMGLGHTYRGAWELILCLAKGHRRPLLRRNVPNVLFAPPNGGSRKPPSLYHALVTASTEPGATVLDPFCGSDPLGRAGLEGYETISLDRYSIVGGEAT